MCFMDGIWCVDQVSHLGRKLSLYVDLRQRLAVKFPDIDEDTMADLLERIGNPPD